MACCFIQSSDVAYWFMLCDIHGFNHLDYCILNPIVSMFWNPLIQSHWNSFLVHRFYHILKRLHPVSRIVNRCLICKRVFMIYVNFSMHCCLNSLNLEIRERMEAPFPCTISSRVLKIILNSIKSQGSTMKRQIGNKWQASNLCIKILEEPKRW
jgi:hypothetical protein